MIKHFLQQIPAIKTYEKFSASPIGFFKSVVPFITFYTVPHDYESLGFIIKSKDSLQQNNDLGVLTVVFLYILQQIPSVERPPGTYVLMPLPLAEHPTAVYRSMLETHIKKMQIRLSCTTSQLFL